MSDWLEKQQYVPGSCCEKPIEEKCTGAELLKIAATKPPCKQIFVDHIGSFKRLVTITIAVMFGLEVRRMETKQIFRFYPQTLRHFNRSRIIFPGCISRLYNLYHYTIALTKIEKIRMETKRRSAHVRSAEQES